MSKEYRLGELFCGPGGIAIGAINANVKGVKIKHQWANDYEFDTCETYRNNICKNDPESVICEDVRKLDIHSLKPIDCFAYGFPCNDFPLVA